MTKHADNSKRAPSGKKATPASWKPGQSGNPHGAPKRGGSMREAYEWALSLTPDAVVEVLSINGSNDLARQFKQMPRGIQLKLLVALRVVSAIMFEPQPGLVNHMIDRVDGPVKTTTKLETWQDELIAALNRGDVSPDEVINELGNDGARAILIAAESSLVSRRETTQPSDSDTKD